ncbi:MAG: hypothetical protein FWF99_05110 [Desulfovibrionaceae bacterium]|nr:hypothetical protein [Desulfovibrionaceae bacterium]
MADTPESPPRADENKTRFSERPLDVDVSSSAGPYPRPRPSRRGLRKLWLAAAGVVVILGLTWVMFSPDEEPAPPPALPPSASPVAAPSADSPSRENTLDFAPVPDQLEPAASPEPADKLETVPDKPLDKPLDKPVTTAPAPAKPAPKPTQATQPKPAQTASPPAKPADKPETVPDKPTDKPTETVDQPAVASSVEKPGTAEISDKWVVNIYSTPDATESLRFLSTLLGQDVGGRVYASEAILEGRLQHRIRVGFFDTKEEAEAAGLKIKERFQLYATPWAVRPIKEEEIKYGGGR